MEQLREHFDALDRMRVMALLRLWRNKNVLSDAAVALASECFAALDQCVRAARTPCVARNSPLRSS